jgi:hypothetical protein
MSDFNPYAAPEVDLRAGPIAADAAGVWQDGGLLVMSKGAELGDRCLRCGGACHGWKLKRKLSWHPQGWYAVILVNVLIYIVVAMIVRHTATIYVPLCEIHRRKRRRAIAIGWLLALLGPVVMVAGTIIGDPLFLANSGSSVTGALQMISLIGGLAMMVAGILYGIIGSQPVVPTRIDKRFVWLKKVCPAVLSTFPPLGAA